MGTRTEAVAGPDFSPSNLKEALAYHQARKQAELAAQAEPLAQQAQQPTQVDAGQAWATMPADERKATASAAGLNRVAVGSIGKADWGKISPCIQAQLSQAIAAQNNQPTLAGEQGQTTAAPATPQ